MRSGVRGNATSARLRLGGCDLSLGRGAASNDSSAAWRRFSVSRRRHRRGRRSPGSLLAGLSLARERRRHRRDSRVALPTAARPNVDSLDLGARWRIALVPIARVLVVRAAIARASILLLLALLPWLLLRLLLPLLLLSGRARPWIVAASEGR
jgi:hypothetical protein